MTVRGLIVDDDANIRDGFARALVRWGPVEIETAATAEAAIATLRARTPQFVFVDMCLDDSGVTSGMGVVYAAKETTEHVAVLSGKQLDTQTQLELERLAVPRFQKPAEPRALIAFMHERVLRGLPILRPTPSAIRHAGEVLYRLGPPLDQNVDLATRASVGVGLEKFDGRKAAFAVASGVNRGWVDRHLPHEWEALKKKR